MDNQAITVQCKPAQSLKCRDSAETVQAAGIVWRIEVGIRVGVAKWILLSDCAFISDADDGGVVSEHANDSNTRTR